MLPERHARAWAWIAIPCVIAFGARLIYCLSAGLEISPDGRNYLRIADNLLLYQCYSLSDPATGLCVPTWSSQPPGYVLFLALLKAVSGARPLLVVIVQNLCFCIALAYSLWVALKLGIDHRFLMAAGLLVGLSPSTLGWSRWILTETLAAAAGLWLLAETLCVVRLRHIAPARLALPIAACALLRWDMAWMALLAMNVAFWFFPFRRIWAGMLFTVFLSSIPYTALSIRAAAVGLPLIPGPAVPTDEVPPGIQAYWKAVAVSESFTASVIWQVWAKRYGGIAALTAPASFVDAKEDEGQGARLLAVLAGLPDGRPVDRKSVV